MTRRERRQPLQRSLILPTRIPTLTVKTICEHAVQTSRRDFLKKASAAGAGVLVAGSVPVARAAVPASAGPPGPVAISSANGLAAVTRAMELLKSGADALD